MKERIENQCLWSRMRMERPSDGGEDCEIGEMWVWVKPEEWR